MTACRVLCILKERIATSFSVYLAKLAELLVAVFHGSQTAGRVTSHALLLTRLLLTLAYCTTPRDHNNERL